MENYEYQNRLRVISEYARGLDILWRYGSDDGLQDWHGSLVTLMFNHIPGSLKHRLSVMQDEADRVYSTLLRHTNHRTRRNFSQENMPIWVVAPDFPTKKNNRNGSGVNLDDVQINDGLHLNGVMMITTDSRLRKALKTHIRECNRYYVRPDRPLRRVDVTLITSSLGGVVDYSLKSLKWKIPDLDTILILPKVRSELSDRRGANEIQSRLKSRLSAQEKFPPQSG